MAIRLSGLTSGMDTDAIVQELVSAYSKKTEKYEKASTKLTWKQDAWKGLNTKIYDLYTKASNMRFSSAYNLRKTSVSDATKATVTAASSAVTGTQKLSIKSTAQSSYMTGAYLGENITGDTTLEELGYKGSYTKIKLKSAADGEIKEIGVKKDTKISEVLTKLKDVGLNASLDTNNGRIFVNAKTSGEKSDFTLYGDSINALDALDALGLNTALIKEENGKKVFTDAAGSFADYYDYYKKALGDLMLEPTEPENEEITTMPTPPEFAEDATEDDKEAALKQYQEDLDAYLTSYTEWSVYRASADNYDQYKKDYYLATSPSFAAYKEKMVAEGYIVGRDQFGTDAEYEEYLKENLPCDTQTYAEKRTEAIDDVLLYQMRGNYAKYKVAFRENANYEIAYKTLENQNNAWENKLSLLENKQAARTSMDSLMETLNGYHEDGRLNEYSEEEIAGLIKEIRRIDIYEVDKDGKKTSTISTGAMDAAIKLCKTKMPQPDDLTEDEWNQNVRREAEELLKVLDNKSEDRANIQKYDGDLSAIKLEDTTDADGNVIEVGVNSEIADIQKKIEDNDIELADIQKKIDANKAFMEANAEMKDIDVLDANNAIDDTKLEVALMEFVEKAKKAAEIYENADHKYDGTKDSAFKIKGSNAEIQLNGVTYTSESNSFAINGLTINTLATTDGEISITTSVDTQGIYDKVKEFLTEYNNVINEMTKLYNADSARDYEPLTDEEKESMSDEQIEKWESKIKDSLLRRDTTLNSIMSVMVNSMAQTFEIGGQKVSLSTFGIQTLGFLNAPKNEHYAYHIDGDEDDENTSGKKDKLMQAIEANPDQVEEFMKKLCENLYTAVDNKMKSTELSSAYKVYNDKEMDKELKKYADAISKWEDKIKDKEDYYYKQFSDMEVALSKLQNQTSSLAGLLGS